MPTTTEVESQLSKYQIIHFACHGDTYSGISAIGSMLILKDDFFNLNSVLELELECPQLIYLSACKTAANHDPRMLDKAIHVARAFQLADFPHVIATLWEIDDRRSVQVAEDVYRYMYLKSGNSKTIDITMTPRAVHMAVRRLKDKELAVAGFQRRVPLYKEPLLWTPYIHMDA